jgi:hypothetical protein
MTTNSEARAGRYEPELEDGWARFLVGTCRGLAWLWCWRELSIPALALIIIYKTGHRDLALTAGTLLVGALVLLLATRPRTVVRALKRCRTRADWLARQIRWPRLCRELGWARHIDKGGWLVPHLISWQAGPNRVTVQVRPLPEHGKSSWDQMADALRRVVGGATVQWREAHGTLTVLVSRTALPTTLPWTPGRSDRTRIVIGQRHGGTPLALDVRRTPQVLFAGATGSGKGAAIRAAIAAALLAGWQVVVLDPKESGEYGWLGSLVVPVYSSVGEALCALEILEGVRRRRQAIIRRHGVDSWQDVPVTERSGWRPILLVVDEAADLLVPAKGRSEQQRQHAALQHQVASRIVEQARKGRSAGIHLIVAIQRPDTAQLGDQGGALRNNLTARLALGSLDAEGIRMLGISTSDPVANTLDGTPGRGICVGFGDDPRPSACQIAWLDQQQARAHIKPATPQGLITLEPRPSDRDPDAPDEDTDG